MQTCTGMQLAKRRFLRIFCSLIWCCTGTCVLWDTRHRGRTCSSVLFMRSTEVSDALFPRSYGDKFRNSGKECTIGLLRTWGLPFPFLITHILRKKGIKGNATDGPITESPYFGCIQWNQSCSHMPRAAPEPEPMDIPEMAAEQEKVAEPESDRAGGAARRRGRGRV
jgi:hypothetical protein